MIDPADIKFSKRTIIGMLLAVVLLACFIHIPILSGVMYLFVLAFVLVYLDMKDEGHF